MPAMKAATKKPRVEVKTDSRVEVKTGSEAEVKTGLTNPFDAEVKTGSTNQPEEAMNTDSSSSSTRFNFITDFLFFTAISFYS